MERSDGGRESVEWDEGSLLIIPAKALQAQVYDLVEGTNPTTHTRTRGGNDRKTENGETAGVASGRFGWIWKCLLPPFDVGFLGLEFDVNEEMLSCPRNP